MLPKIAVITGPTATGKTTLSIALAKKTGGEIVSADSMQVYQYLDIGTAKPTTEEQCGVRHHMLGVVSPFEQYSVARYVEEASVCVKDILERGKLPILVGGTGLYIDSLIRGRRFAQRGDDGMRQELADRYDRDGGQALLEALRIVDRTSAEKLSVNDKKRIVRALEIYHRTGITRTEHDEISRKTPPCYDARMIALSFTNRADLYTQINKRVDDMMEKGLQAEVLHLLEMGLTRGHTAMQAIGYKELAVALSENGSVDEAVEIIKMESRRYAKRQLSWLRRNDKLRWILWNKQPDFSTALEISTQNLE